MVPTLPANKEGILGNDGVVPDGYITHVVWDKAPGKSLNQDKVWDAQAGSLREAVRAKSRDVWEYLQTPLSPVESKTHRPKRVETLWMRARDVWTREHHLRRGNRDDVTGIFYTPSA